MTSDKRLVEARSRLVVPMLEEGDQGEPTNQGEGVYREVLGAVRVVRIEQTQVARPGNRS